MKLLITKQIENFLNKNVRFCTTAPNEYILFQNKHIPQGESALKSKFEIIRRFAGKHRGECRITSEPYISGSELRLRFYMVCDCVAAKAFDKEIESVSLKQNDGRNLLQ